MHMPFTTAIYKTSGIPQIAVVYSILTA